MADLGYNAINPDYKSEIKNRRRMAEMLAKTSEFNPNQMAGGMVVPISPLEGLVRGLSKGVETYQSNKADTMEQDAENQKNKAYADVLGKMQTNPQGAIEVLGQIDPKMAFELQKEILDRQNKIDVQKLKGQSAGGGYEIDPETGEITRTYSNKPLPPALQKIEDDSLQSISGAKTALGEIDTVQKNLTSGTLDLSPYNNIASNVKNFLGMSDPNSRAYADFKRSLETSRNSILLLHKGVQTEGDATRAMNQILDNKNDPEVVKAAMADLVNLNNQAISMQKARIQRGRMDVNARPLDVDALLGGQQTDTPLAPPATDTVKVRVNGKVGSIPKARLQNYLDNGAELVQ